MGQFTQNGVIYEELPDGNVRVVGYAPAPSATVAPNPQRLAEKQAELSRQAAKDAIEASDKGSDNARADAAERRAQLEWNAKFFPDGTPRPSPLTKQQTGAARLKLQGINAIANQVARVEAALEKAEKDGFVGPIWGRVPGSGSLDAESSVLDKSIAQLAPLIRQLTRTPGEGAMSDYESRLAAMALPARSDNPAALRESLAGIRDLLTQTQAGYSEMLETAGAPDEQQAERELDKAAAFVDSSPPDLPPANEAGGNAPLAPASGSGLRDLARPDINSMVQSMMAAGAGLATINSALKAKGASPIPMAEFARAKDWMAKNPGQAYPVDAKETRALTMLERFAGSPLGAGVASYANAATAGTAAALAGDRGKGALEAMERLNPGAALTGNLLGGITGAGAAEAMLGAKLAGTAVAKFAPRFADATYGALYGFNEADDGDGASGAATGALAGVLGGVVGEKAIKGVGRAMTGVTDPAVQYLRARGVPMTAGQVLGGFAKSIEDKATSTPLIGDMIVKRRTEGLEGFDRAAMAQASSPIGFTPQNIGKEGVDEMLDAVGDSYDNATAGARVPLDDVYAQDFTDVAALGGSLPDDLRARLGLALNNRVNPINDAGEMTGETYQQAMRGLKSYKGEATKPGFEQDYRDALSAAQNALTGQMVRGGGEGVVSGLRSADEAYRGIKTVQDAAMRADGANYLFTPSQLQDALKVTNRKFPGETPLSEMADMGQQVLPSRIPDSGTAGRAAQLLVPGAIGGAAGGGYAAGDIGGAGAGGLGLTLALLAGGSRTGQRALTAALLDRPEALTRAGKLLADLAKFGGGVGAGVSTPLLVGQ